MSQERITPSEIILPQWLIVEIGCGNFPFPVSGERRLKANERYLGVELRHYDTWGDHDPVTTAIEKLNKSDPPQEGIFEVIEWDGRMMELSDRSADEVHMQNVIGDENFINTRAALLKEGARILKKSGVLRIVEDEVSSRAHPSWLREMMEPLGMVQINEGREQDLDLLRNYCSLKVDQSPLAFVAEFGFVDNVDELPSNVILFKPRKA